MQGYNVLKQRYQRKRLFYLNTRLLLNPWVFLVLRWHVQEALIRRTHRHKPTLAAHARREEQRLYNVHTILVYAVGSGGME